jgi:hypothetical protein
MTDKLHLEETRYVVAPSYQRFVHWCHENGITLPFRSVVFVNRPEQAQGVRLDSPDQIIDLGGDYELVMALQARVRP